MPTQAKFILRKGTLAAWTSANPVLASGEPGYETDTKVLRIGDGTTAFLSLVAFPNSAAIAAAVDAAEAAAAAAEAAAAEVDVALTAIIPTLVTAPGAMIFFPSSSAPAGFLKLNGATGLLRADFPNLWSFIQGSGMLAGSEGAKQYWQFGPGDGSTTFSLFDARGLTMMAWDDGRGMDPGRALMEFQDQMVLSHAHGVNDPSHAHSIYDPGHAHNYTGTSGNYPAANGSVQVRTGTSGAGTSASGTGIGIYGAFTGISIQAAGGAANRVKSLAPLLCIKF